MTISASLIKELREATGAGMMDCKKALSETSGSFDDAIDWLRKQGLSAAAKKASRLASEGLVGVVSDGKAGALIEVNAETDFVSRNEEFQQFVAALSRLALEARSALARKENSVDALGAMPYPNSERTVAEELTDKIATIGENMNIRRLERLNVDQGLIVSYVHNAAAEGMGRIGVLVALESEAPAEALEPLGKQLAMHVAAAAPASLSEEDLDPDFVKRERQILIDQAVQSGKPEDIAEKMVEGRMKKFIKEVALLEQIFVIDGETPVSQVIENAAKEAGKPITLKGFVRYALGEGIEKEEADFAAEVAAQLKK